jgi:cytochrome d ubiquinol oxidase subunit II
MFSGFYLALFLLLLALIGRGVAFEYRSKDPNPRWRVLWDWLIFLGSIIPALLLGVAFGNLVRGVPIDAEMNYVGGFFNLLNPYALLAGVATVLLFTLHGAIFLCLKTDGEIKEKAQASARRLWLVVVLALLALLVATYLTTDIYQRLGVNPGIVPITGMVAILLAGFFLRKMRQGWAFVTTAVAIAFSLVTAFLILYPRVMISSINPEYSLTIYNASSSPYPAGDDRRTLIFVPIVLVYQAWSYWVFRKRLTTRSPLVY